MNRPRIRIAWFAMLLPLGVLVQTAGAQQEDTRDDLQDGPLTPGASDGGKAELIQPRPVGDDADPLNRYVAAETVDGLVLTVTIDGDAVRLDSAVPARVPRKLARAERKPGPDAVTATAMANGRVVSRTVVPDTVLNASEGEGLVRTPLRQIALVLATERPVDTVTIEAPATGARASLDVRGAYAEICKADPNSRWCPRQR